MNDYKETWNAMKRGEITEEEFNERITTQDKEDEILQEWEDKVNVQKRKAKELINDFVKEKAIDGIIVKNDVGSYQRSVESYIAFNSNQIKNVTNENPTNNEDIRYQARINAITDAESMTQENGIASYTEERLEDLYTDYAAMNEDYSQAYLTRLSPQEFLKLTTEDDAAYNRIVSEAGKLDREKIKKNSQPIYLRIYDDGEVKGHEGRHRMAALMDAGITSVNKSELRDINTVVQKAVDILTKYPGIEYREKNPVITNLDTGDKVQITKKSLKHGMHMGRSEATTFVSLNIGDAVKYGIKVNEAIGNRNNADSSYVLMGCMMDEKNNNYYYRIVVKRYDSNRIGDYYDDMYAVKAKKEETFTAVMPTRVTANADASNISSNIKVSDFLNEVKEYYGNDGVNLLLVAIIYNQIWFCK